MAEPERFRIAVCDPASSYRLGLGSALRAAGYTVRDIGDLRDRRVLAEIDALLLTVRSASDWQVLRELAAAKRTVGLVALLVDATIDRHAEALRCGADGVVAWDRAPEEIVPIVTAALDGMTVLRTDVARSIAASGPPLYDPGWVSAEEIEWLKLLAQGATMQQLANKAGYSERALYRVLHGLYGRMRVSNRTEAILQASRWGLLDR